MHACATPIRAPSHAPSRPNNQTPCAHAQPTARKRKVPAFPAHPAACDATHRDHPSLSLSIVHHFENVSRETFLWHDATWRGEETSISTPCPPPVRNLATKAKRPMLSRSPSRCCARISSRAHRTLTRCPRTVTFPAQLPRSPRDRRITRTVATLPARPPLRSPFPTRPPRGCRITRTSTALPARLPHPIASHPPSPSPSHS